MFPYRFFFSSRRRHTRSKRDWSSDVCSSDLQFAGLAVRTRHQPAFVRGGRGKGYLSDIGRFAMLERDRSEERRVGKECRTRGGPYHKKKKKSRVERLNVLAVAEWNTPRLDMN